MKKLIQNEKQLRMKEELKKKQLYETMLEQYKEKEAIRV